MKLILQKACVRISIIFVLAMLSFFNVNATVKHADVLTYDDGPSVKNITVYTTGDSPVKVELTSSSSLINGYRRAIQSSAPSGTYTITNESNTLVTNVVVGNYTVTYTKTSGSGASTLTQQVSVKKLTISYPSIAITRTGSNRIDESVINAINAATVSVKIDNGSPFALTRSTNSNGFYLKYSATNYDDDENKILDNIERDKTKLSTKVSFVVAHISNSDDIEDDGSNVDFKDVHEVSATQPDNTISLTSNSNSDKQVVCIGTQIASITYSTTGATGVNLTGLPAGVTNTFANNILTISGTPTSTGTFSYTILLTGGTGTISKTGSITINALPTVSVSGTNVICIGGLTTLTASGANSYTWGASFNAASLTVSPTTTSTYTVTGTDVNGCVSAATYTVTVNQLPTVAITETDATGKLNNDGIICVGGSTTLTASGANTYTWGVSSNASALTVSPTTTTTYTVTGTDANGCVNSATYTVTVNQLPTVSVSGTNVICVGNSTTLTASGANNFAWGSSALSTVATLTASPTTTTAYTVKGVDDNGCENSATYTVTVNSLPSISITEADASGNTNNDGIICIGAQSKLTGEGAVSYVWSTSATTNSITVSPTVTTAFTATGTDANGCVNTGSYTVTVNANPPTPTLVANDNGNNFSSNIILTASVTNLDLKSLTYYWLFNNGTTPILTTNGDNTYTLNLTSQDGTYTVKVKDVNGCESPVSNVTTVGTVNSPSSVNNPSTISNASMSDGEDENALPTNYVMESSADEINTEVITFDLGIGQYIYDRKHVNSSYTLLAYNELNLGDKNIIEKGAAGIINNKTSNRENNAVKFKIKSDLQVNETGAFIQVPFTRPIELNQSITYYPTVADIDPTKMPTFPTSTKSTAKYTNTKEEAKNDKSIAPQFLSGTYRNLTLQKGTTTVLYGDNFGTIKVEQGADVTFSPSTDVIYIKDLEVVKGPINGSTIIRFSRDVQIYVSDRVSIGSNVWFNPSIKKVTFYIGTSLGTTNKESEDENGFYIKGGKTIFNANVFSPTGSINVIGGYAYGEYGKDKKSSSTLEDDEEKYANLGTDYVTMSGFYIANKIISKGKNIKWSNQLPPSANPSSNAPFSASDLTTETIAEDITTIPVVEGLTVSVAPNPSAYSFTIKVASKSDSPYTMLVQDAMGNVIESRYNLLPNTSVQIGQNFRAGSYYVQIIQNDQRKVVKLFKVL